MPTAPLHQGCAASHAISSTPSSCSCLGVLVEQQTAQFTATAKVDADARVAVACKIGMSEGVSFVSPVALAIRQILQNCRNRILLGVLRQPDASRQHRAVFQRYQSMLDDPHSSVEGRDNHKDTPIGDDYGTRSGGQPVRPVRPTLSASSKHIRPAMFRKTTLT